MSNDETHSGGPRHSRFSLRDYIREEWKATVFVAACVTIAHLGFNWLHAVDSYAFMALGNRVSHTTGDANAARAADSAVVVRIDEQSFRTRYRERTPLDRCELSKQLAAIYAAQPNIVVVDLDLSPADWTRRERSNAATREKECQTQLETTLASSAPRGIRTVVMAPFDTFDVTIATNNADWQRQQELAGVRFGDAALPVSYGITLDHYSGSRTLYEAARRESVTAPIADEATPPSREHRRIDARAYTRKLQYVLTSWTDPDGGTRLPDEDLTATLGKLLPPPDEANPLNRVVFFGAGYGQEDTYLTPFGRLYGVEVHAAAFMSDTQSPWCHLIALIIEIAIAFMFGIIIVYCWTQYFAWRSDQRYIYEQLASVWVAIMLLGLLAAITVALIVAWLLLGRYGMWISPIPVAAGMLIESCMAGSVEAAVRRLHQIQPAGPAVAADSLITLSTGIRRAVWVLALAGALRLTMFH